MLQITFSDILDCLTKLFNSQFIVSVCVAVKNQRHDNEYPNCVAYHVICYFCEFQDME